MTSLPTTALALLLAAAPDPGPAKPKADDAVALRAGDAVQFDLTALPSRYEGAGKVTCKGTVILATGPEETLCTRTFRFEVPPDDSRLTYVFRPTVGGRETRIPLPLTRQARPVDFKAPAAGSLLSPAPVVIQAEVTDRAATSAAAAGCRSCRGGAFALQSFEITSPPAPVDGTISVRLKVTTTAPAPTAPAPAK